MIKGKIVHIFYISVLTVFFVFVWPYVYMAARDWLLDEGPQNVNSSLYIAQPHNQYINVTECNGYNVVRGGGNHSGRLRIALLTVAIIPEGDNAYKDQEQLSLVVRNLVNKFKYASGYGYDFIPIFWNPNDPDIHSAWAKIMALQRYLPQYDWIWCTDLDLFVTNRLLSIERQVLRRVPPGKIVVLSKDCNGLNTGSFFIRNSPEALQFLDAVYSYRHDKTLPLYDAWFEQSAFVYMYNNSIGNTTSMFHFIPQHLINSYGVITCGSRWRLGDFAVHFPGGISNKQQAWQDLVKEGGDVLKPMIP